MAAHTIRRPPLLIALLMLFALASFAAAPIAPANAQEQCTAPVWSSSTVYVGGDQVTHAGRTWEAKWWTQGNEPGTADVWLDQGACEGEPDDDPVGPCVHPPWDSATVYLGGDRVTHNDRHWLAKWWTQGEEPGVTGSGVWTDEGACGDDDPPDEPPDTPTGLAVTGTTATTVSLNWDDATGAADYLVFRDGGQVGTPTSSGFTDTGLSPSTQYNYTVQARNVHGTSGTAGPVPATTDDDDDPPGPFVDRRVGYFTQWGIYGRDFMVNDLVLNGTAGKLSHINYAFGNVNTNGECYIVNQTGAGDAWADYQRSFNASESVDGVGDTWDQELKGNFNQLRKLKQMHPGLKVQISLGGWTWSKNFSDAALTPASRQQLVESCIDLYLRGDLPIQGGDPAGGPGSAFGVFDGIDLDWEWPASEGHPDNTVRPQDRENFTALVQEFRNQLDAFEAETGREYSLTAFVPADPRKIQAGFEVSQLMPNFDFVTVQGYDLHGAWENTTNHQANLFSAPGDPSPVTFSVDTAIQEYLNRGAPADKLVVGVPYYGRGWTGVSAGPNGDGLFQSSSGAAPGTWEAGYDDYKVVKNKSGTRHRDTSTGALWLYDGNEFWTYDDPVLLQQKMNYVKNNGLGGAMMWSLDGDDTQGSLINAIDSGLG
jgi:chitinase